MDSIRKCDHNCNRYVDILTRTTCCDGCSNGLKHNIDCILYHEELKSKWLTSKSSINITMNNNITKWSQSFAKSNTTNITEIFLLPKDRPLLILKNIIENSKMKAVIGFDYDQTISLTIKNLLENKSFNTLRGNTESQELFNYLYQKEIPWFIISARGTSSVEIIYKDSLKYDIKSNPVYNITSESYIVGIDNKTILSQPSQLSSQKKTISSYPIMFNCDIDNQKIYCGIYNNCISCSSEGNGEAACAYEKDYAMELCLHVYEINPELIIFVDDNAKNICTLHNYYLTSQRKVHFIGIIYEPFTPEKDHNEYFKYIKKQYGVDKQCLI